MRARVSRTLRLILALGAAGVISLPATAAPKGKPNQPRTAGRSAVAAPKAPTKPGANSPDAAPPIALTVTPAQIRLSGGGAQQYVVVTARYARGPERDVTHLARFSFSSSGVAKLDGNRILPARDGSTRLVVRLPESRVSGEAAVTVTDAWRPLEPTFTGHVVPVLNKFGCASGACHGSFSGRGGLRLSLFGYEPQMDFNALARAGGSRRINRARPDHSLMLAKPTLAVPHAGGRRLTEGSRAHRILSGWIADGAHWDRDEPKLESLAIFPSERVVLLGQRQQFLVTARYADGTSVDVTDLAKYGSNADDVASIDFSGAAKAERTGDAAITAEFSGQIVTARVLVPGDPKLATSYPAQARSNYVDDLVLAKLQKLGISPSEPCTDLEFLRRVSLDLCGRTPRPDEIRAFLTECEAETGTHGGKGVKGQGEGTPVTAAASGSKGSVLTPTLTLTPTPASKASKDPYGSASAPNPNLNRHPIRPALRSRAKKIDELLLTEEYAEYWAGFLSDLTGNDNRFHITPREPVAHRWNRWFYARLKENTPWDQIARGVIAATSRDGAPVDQWVAAARKDNELRNGRGVEKWDTSEYEKRKSLDLYWMKSGNDPNTIGRTLSYAFLGVKLECAECHKHPFDRWTQTDYSGFAAFFQRMGRGMAPETRKEVTALKLDASGLNEIYFNAAAKGPAPRILGGEPLPGDGQRDPREVLADWMAQPTNPYFAKAIVNRIWARHLGRGIVDPPDAFSQANPPTNPQLLDALAVDFVKHGFDLRHLHRTILGSLTYQRSWKSNPSNAGDLQNFSHYQVKQLPAEVMLDAINVATGTQEDWGNFGPPGARAIAVGPSRIGGMAGYVLKTFGRPTRSQSCDCERSVVPGLPQALYLINDQHVQTKLSAPNGRLAALLKAEAADEKLVEEVYLWTLCRPPSAPEKTRALSHVTAAGDRGAGFQDLMWALLNTREFFTNH